ncbi:hypothetical protein [Streptomyces sp. GESEQ-35]|uniref:hypothetical protein n=1 Tax=Streptomyces sp. GESEQ-35 TaxID=2812657 RepID=UPI001B32CCC2|nr:hypothetical protein [Streptomyces sp. GESEQ-35]
MEWWKLFLLGYSLDQRLVFEVVARSNAASLVALTALAPLSGWLTPLALGACATHWPGDRPALG